MFIILLHYIPEYFYLQPANIYSTKAQYGNFRSENCRIFTCGFFIANIVFVLLLLVLISQMNVDF
jgi:hypothetical protein